MAVQRKQTTKPLNNWFVVFSCGLFFFFNDSSVFRVSPVVSDKNVKMDVVWRCLILNVAGQRKSNLFIFIPSQIFQDYLVYFFTLHNVPF